MKADGITLSTVGAGGGANPFLEELATKGGGRFYAAANPASIPDIFLKETQQVSGQQIVEEPFFPILTSSSPILRGLDDGLPQLRGYNGTTAKPAAQTVLVTARDDPLLAQWQYGLGRSVAWTSDSTGRWARDWLAWDGFNRFFSQLVSWTFPGEETDGIEARFDSKDGSTSLHVESVEADGSPRDFYSTRATVVGPDLEPVDVALVQVAPGVYEVPLGEVDAGRLRAPGDPDAPGFLGAGPDDRAGRPDRRRVPPPRRRRAVPGRPSVRDRRRRGRDGPRPLGPRPHGHEPLHRPLAAPAADRAPALAARHRAAARVGRASRARGRSRLARRHAPATRCERAADGDRRGPVRGSRTGERRPLAGGHPSDLARRASDGEPAPRRPRRRQSPPRPSRAARSSPRRARPCAAAPAAPAVPERRRRPRPPRHRQPPTHPTRWPASATRSGGLASADRPDRAAPDRARR